ncbi:MAG: hypothetical protein KA257_09285 [Opitutaceae bacterium]|nr:hypothetical protein [Opitutaceae bacterium]
MKKSKKPAKAAKLKVVPIEEADLDNMTEAQIRRIYAKDIKERAEYIWREQGHGGRLTMGDCIEGTVRDIRNGMWPYREDD